MTKKAHDAKTAIMAGALVATGVCEVFEGLESGESLISCVVGAVEKTRERGKAIKEAVRRQRSAARRKKRRLKTEERGT